MVSPDSSETVTTSPCCSAPAKRTPVLNAILRLRNDRSSCLEMASSSAATSRGRASTIVTSEPKDLKTEANSTPMTPPPRTTTRAGTSSRDSAWSLVMMRPPISRPGRRLGVGTGGQHDVAPDQPATGDLDGVGGHEPALALDVVDLAGLHEPLQALVEPADDAVLVAVDPAHVDRLEGRLDAELLALACAVGDLGRVQQRLGRDAAHVQAGAAELALLDERDRQAQLGRPQGAGVAAAATSEDDDVVGVLGFSRHRGRSLALPDRSVSDAAGGPGPSRRARAACWRRRVVEHLVTDGVPRRTQVRGAARRVPRRGVQGQRPPTVQRGVIESRHGLVEQAAMAEALRGRRRGRRSGHGHRRRPGPGAPGLVRVVASGGGGLRRAADQRHRRRRWCSSRTTASGPGGPSRPATWRGSSPARWACRCTTCSRPATPRGCASGRHGSAGAERLAPTGDTRWWPDGRHAMVCRTDSRRFAWRRRARTRTVSRDPGRT